MIENQFASLSENTGEVEHPQHVKFAQYDSKQQIQFTKLSDLSNYVDSLINITDEEQVTKFKYHFYDFEKYNESEYENFMNIRSKCFEEYEDLDTINNITNAIATFEPLEIKPLIEKCILNLSKEKPTNHSLLFLIGIIVSQRPDLITPENFEFSHEEFIKYSPILCWIFYKSLESDKIAHLDPLLSHQLIEIFLDELLSKDKECDATAICAAHLIKEAFERPKIFRISSNHFAKILKISVRMDTPRDAHVSHVLLPLITKLSAIDKKALAANLMEEFPDAPDYATDTFLHEITKKGNVTFIDGWVEAHSLHKEASLNYLNATAGKISDRIICKFPKEDLKNGSNRIKLAAVQVELMNTSFRFCFIVILLLIILFIYNKKMM